MFRCETIMIPVLLTFFAVANPINAQAQVSSVAGQYNAILSHSGTDFFQYASITLRTVNSSGVLKISANVRVFFGKANSNEYLSYEYNDVPLNLLTRQISIQSEDNDVSMIGYLRNGTITGEWFSTLVGSVGTFEAKKSSFPASPKDGILVKSLSGHYRGTLTNQNQDSSLPERLSFSLVTTQDNSSRQPTLHISGKTRLYLGKFDSQEYVELAFNDIQFNYFSRFFTAKTEQYGLTFKGYMSHDGIFDGDVFSDAIGVVGPAVLTKQ